MSHSIEVNVNGIRIRVDIEARLLLVHFLRELVGLSPADRHAAPRDGRYVAGSTIARSTNDKVPIHKHEGISPWI